MDDASVAPQQVEELRGYVDGLTRVVTSLQETVKDQIPMTTRRRTIGWIILLVLVAALVGLLIVQRIDVASQQRTSVAQCEAFNDHLRTERSLYQALIIAEQQIPSTTGTNISIKQTRIAAYTRASDAIRLTDCRQLYG